MVETISPADLAGEWQFTRRLRDGRTSRFGWASGSLTVDALTGSWDEAGQLDWAGRSFPITRTMGFATVDGEWWMTFEDGRPFHPWRQGVPVEHPCGADVYRGLVVVALDASHVRIGWDVRGPAKEQRILTTYRRWVA